MAQKRVNGVPEKLDDASESSTDRDFSKDKDWNGFLTELGLYGFDDLELPILCSLITGDPILLIGAHGTAKTAMASVLADALRLNFHAYDASKAMFEDMVGFPNPDALSTGELDYVPTEISLWDKEFILVDEISRASAQTQSKWLEIIRSRKVMGQRLDQLKYIFAAMNPPGTYDGANPLDPALAGRFAWILKVPEAGDMSHEERINVTQSIGSDDAPMVNDAFTTTIQDGSNVRVFDKLGRYRKRLEEIQGELSGRISNYISKLSESVFASSEKEIRNLDGRRIGILRRNLLTAEVLRGESGSRSDLYETVLLQSLPHLALGQDIPDHLYKMAHREAYQDVFRESVSSERSVGVETLRDRVLDEETLDEVVAPLALLGREFYLNFSDETVTRNHVDTFRRILHTGCHELKEQWNRLKQWDEYQSTHWNQSGGIRDLAQILLMWWAAEKDKNIRNIEDEFRDVLERLDKKIHQFLEEEGA